MLIATLCRGKERNISSKNKTASYSLDFVNLEAFKLPADLSVVFFLTKIKCRCDYVFSRKVC